MAANPSPTDSSALSTTSTFGRQLAGPTLHLAQAAWFVTLVASVGILVSKFYAVLTYPADRLFLGGGLQPDWLQVSQFYATFLVPVQMLLALLALSFSGLVFWRQRNDLVAILVSLTLMTLIGFVSLGVADVNPWASPLLEHVTTFVISVGLSTSLLVTLVLPDGHFVPGWTRWPALVWTGWMVLQIFVRSIYFYSLPAPVWGILQMAVFGLGTWAQLYRYRHTDSLIQRQQTRLIVYSIVQLVVLQIVYQLLTLQLPIWENGSLGGVGLVLTAARLTYYGSRLIFMVLFVLAVLRYRLWGIEFIVNRSLVYGLLTLGLAGLFAGVLYLVSLLVPGQATLIAVAVTAGLAGLLFQPARRRLQRFVDRRLYNIQINYQSRPAPAPAPADLPPARITDYQNLTLIGHGGMAEVYQATHPSSGQKVAIKLLFGEALDSPEYRQRMEREGKVMAQLEHPNIARVLDYGQTADEPPRPYLVIEYLAGEDLGRRLKARGRLSLQESLAILGQLAGALAYAHARGIVHRDIKPSNVMLVPDGPLERAVLMDFGIAKLLGSQTVMTEAGGLVGTFDYIAPEQIQSAATVDARADLYALGILAYQMLTGELPFKHPNPGGLLIAHLTQPPPNPRLLASDLPTSVAQAILQALAKKPEERFAGVQEFVEAMRPAS